MLKSEIQASPLKRALRLVGASAALAVAALGFSGAAQARGDVGVSLGIALPGVQIGVGNAYPVYSQPVYSQPFYGQDYYEPVYVQRPPVYYAPAPVYYEPAPVYYNGGHRYRGGRHGHGGHRGFQSRGHDDHRR